MNSFFLLVETESLQQKRWGWSLFIVWDFYALRWTLISRDQTRVVQHNLLWTINVNSHSACWKESGWPNLHVRWSVTGWSLTTQIRFRLVVDRGLRSIMFTVLYILQNEFKAWHACFGWTMRKSLTLSKLCKEFNSALKKHDSALKIWESEDELLKNWTLTWKLFVYIAMKS